MPVADTLLRLAEEPAFYAPRWSPSVMDELDDGLFRFGYNAAQVRRRLDAMQGAYPEAMVTGYEHLIPSMTNHEDDRHVLAAAVRASAHTIVRDNKRHFADADLAPYGLECLTANEFLEHQYHLDPDLFITKIIQQARDINRTVPDLLSHHVPCLAKLIRTRT